MTLLFWIIVALDGVLFVVLLTLGLTPNGTNDGGREMALFFYVLVPAIIVGGGVLLFVKSESTFWRGMALLIVGGPGLSLAYSRLQSAAIDYRVRKNAEGSGYFSGHAMKTAGVAVVRRDVVTLEQLKRDNPTFDANTKGTRGMTLMQLALTEAFDASTSNNPNTAAAASPSSPIAPIAPISQPATSLDVVRALLALGADANAGLGLATKLRDGAILDALLAAGAKPNYASDDGPVVFEWLGMMPLANFAALVDRGLDLNAVDHIGRPLLVDAAQADRWDIVLLLLARGADASRGDAQQLRLAGVVQSRMESTLERTPEMKADIARVKAKLDSADDAHHVGGKKPTSPRDEAAISPHGPQARARSVHRREAIHN